VALNEEFDPAPVKAFAPLQSDPEFRDLVERVVEQDERASGQAFEVLEVKGKFGGLCFYTNYKSGAIERRIPTAQAESLRTCEVCGRSDTRRGHRWIRTPCDEHARQEAETGKPLG
jgi:hypothetical protein